MYEYQARVRYSETDPSGVLSMQALIRLLQDVSYLHAEDCGRGVAYQAELDRAWFLLSWNIRLAQPPMLSQSYTVDTYFYRARHAISHERLTMRDDAGTDCAIADVLWGYVDRATKQAICCPEGYWREEDYAPAPADACITRKILIPEGGIELEPVTVRDVTTDTNGHVNNVRFTELAMTLADAEIGVKNLRAEFLRQTFGHSVLYPYLCRTQGKTLIAMRDAQRVPYAVFEFSNGEN